MRVHDDRVEPKAHNRKYHKNRAFHRTWNADETECGGDGISHCNRVFVYMVSGKQSKRRIWKAAQTVRRVWPDFHTAGHKLLSAQHDQAWNAAYLGVRAGGGFLAVHRKCTGAEPVFVADSCRDGG